MHGCKYGNKKCPVEFGGEKQKFACEVCDFMLGEGGGLELAYLMNEMYDKGFSAAIGDINHLYKCGCDTPGGFGCLGS
jgi:hypothetical protein